MTISAKFKIELVCSFGYLNPAFPLVSLNIFFPFPSYDSRSDLSANITSSLSTKRHTLSTLAHTPTRTSFPHLPLAAKRPNSQPLFRVLLGLKMARPNPPLAVPISNQRIPRPITLKERQAISSMLAWDFDLQNALSPSKRGSSVFAQSFGPRHGPQIESVELMTIEPMPVDAKKARYCISKEMVFEGKDRNKNKERSEKNILGMPHSKPSHTYART